jgi:hypothetical protein
MPLTKRLINLPPNDYFYALFRAWYLICHMTDVMPRRPDLEQIKESVLSIFGVYRGAEPNWGSPPRPEWVPTVETVPRGQKVELRRPSLQVQDVR